MKNFRDEIWDTQVDRTVNMMSRKELEEGFAGMEEEYILSLPLSLSLTHTLSLTAHREEKPDPVQTFAVLPHVQPLAPNRQYEYKEEYEIHRLPGPSDPKTDVLLFSPLHFSTVTV